MDDLLGLLPAPPNSSTTRGRVGCGGQTQPDPQCRSVPGVWARSVIPLGIPSLNPAPAGRLHRVGSPGTGTPRAGMLASHLPFKLCLWMSLARGSQVGRPLNERTGLVGPTGKGHEPRLFGWPGASVSQRLRAPMTCGQERQRPNNTANSDESQNESCFFLPSHSIVLTTSRGRLCSPRPPSHLAGTSHCPSQPGGSESEAPHSRRARISGRFLFSFIYFYGNLAMVMTQIYFF